MATSCIQLRSGRVSVALPMDTTRRSFLKGTLATAGVIAVGCDNRTAGQPDAAQRDAETADAPRALGPRGDLAMLPLAAASAMGVSAADATSSSVLLWTHWTNVASLGVSVFRANETATPVVEVEALVPIDGVCVYAASGLAPDTVYQYCFWRFGDGGFERSELGRFRTAPAADARGVVRLGAISCMAADKSFAVVQRAAREPNLHAMLYLGDIAYCDGVESLADYRGKYRETFALAGHVQLRRNAAMVATWDDHEVGNNWNPESIGAARYAAAKQAFAEHVPIVRAAPEQIWRKFSYGQTVEVFVLDCRGERKPSQNIYLSQAQMAWLKAGLSASTAQWKLIVNSVPITRMPDLYPSDADRWEGYTAQRNEILNHIDAAPIPGVIWLSGDFHFAFVANVSPSGPGANQIEVLAGPGAQLPNPAWVGVRGSQFRYVTGKNNYAVLEFSPERRTVEVQYYDDGDAPFHRELLTFA